LKPRVRETLAWLGGALFTIGLHHAGAAQWGLASGLSWAVLLTGPFLALGLPRIRERRWPRPAADMALFAVCGAFPIILFGAAIASRDLNDFFRDTSRDDLVFAGGSAAAYLALTALLAIAAGLIGGVFYWLLAGRPRPPNS